MPPINIDKDVFSKVMASVRIKNITLGEGLPKICVPLTCGNLSELEDALNDMRDKPFELIEWRVDKFRECAADTLTAAANAIRAAFPDKPLIFTIRTNQDMDDLEISDEAYADAITYAAKKGLCDIIDIEYSRGAELVSKLIKIVHDCGVKALVSRHIADSTPDEDAILDTLHNMQAVGADIVKYAAMPKLKGDVKTLMDATYRYASAADSVPVITMSMGKLGVLSRISGSLTGSCLTFGTVGAASAPGQIDCEELSRILNVLGERIS